MIKAYELLKKFMFIQLKEPTMQQKSNLMVSNRSSYKFLVPGIVMQEVISVENYIKFNKNTRI